MRFLILSAFLVSASAAPSGTLAPVAVAPVIPVATPILPLGYSAISPTISSGDIQAAAAIDAQVKANDNAIASVDKGRELVNNDQLKERAEEQFWSHEDKKWQEIDALKTAEAQFDGYIANNAGAFAKSAITPYVAVAPATVSLGPVYYNPGIVAPVLKTVDVKEVKQKSAEVKTAEASDSIAVEAEKTGEKALVKSTVVPSVVAPLPLVDPLKYSIVTPGVIPPVLKYGAVPYAQTISLGPQIGLVPQIDLASQISLASQIGLANSVYRTW